MDGIEKLRIGAELARKVTPKTTEQHEKVRATAQGAIGSVWDHRPDLVRELANTDNPGVLNASASMGVEVVRAAIEEGLPISEREEEILRKGAMVGAMTVLYTLISAEGGTSQPE